MTTPADPNSDLYTAAQTLLDAANAAKHDMAHDPAYWGEPSDTAWQRGILKALGEGTWAPGHFCALMSPDLAIAFAEWLVMEADRNHPVAVTHQIASLITD